MVSDLVNIPIISSGGAGKNMDVADVIQNTNIDAVAIASLFHYNMESIDALKKYLVNDKSIQIRL